MSELAGKRVLIIATDGFEQSELESPRDSLTRAGAEVQIASPEGRAIKGWKDGDWGQSVTADLTLADARAEDYDALVLPGGVINPDQLRTDEVALQLIRNFYESGRVVAAICHGPWLLAEAGIADGRKLTSYKSIRTDLVNAGALWSDEAVVTDKGIVTSRSPEDLEAFNKKIAEEVLEGRHPRR